MKKILLTTLIAAATSTSFAAITVPGGTVTINGEITAGACAISSDDANKIVTLDTVPTHKLIAAGAGKPVGAQKPFNITLVDCDDSADTVKVSFSGLKAAGDDASLLANAAGAGMAQNVAIQLYDEDNKALLLGGESREYTLAPTTKMTFAADYVAVSTEVTGGSVSAVANFELAYQ